MKRHISFPMLDVEFRRVLRRTQTPISQAQRYDVHGWLLMKGVSLVLLAVLGLAAPTKPAPAQSKSAVSSDAPTLISDAKVSKDGTVQIRFNNGRSIQVPPEDGQAGREHLQVAASGRSVGWLVDDASVGSYSVPTTLTVYTVGKPLRHFGDGLVLIDWDFIDNDKRIQFSSSQAHGPGPLGSAWKSTISRRADC